MGGPGSGTRWLGHRSADCSDGYRAIDVRCWQREGLLAPGQTFTWNLCAPRRAAIAIQVQTESDRVILKYPPASAPGSVDFEEFAVRLSWSSCNYGGGRAWFVCPTPDCGRRVAILYAGRRIACRHCLGLVYRSQRQRIDERAELRADKIRQRLGWKPGILNDSGGRPKGMRQRTFERLSDQHDLFQLEALIGKIKRYRFDPKDWL